MDNSKPRANILVVDEQEDITWSLSQALSGTDFNANVITASNGKEALDKLSDETINLLITDIMMLEVDGQDLFLEVKKKYPAVAVIVMTALPSSNFKKQAVLGDNLFFVEKPFDINKLKQQIVKIFAEKPPANLALAGINLTDIIQLKCLAGSTTALQIHKGSQQGAVYFKEGEIIHATCNQQEGEEAFLELLALGKGIITTMPLPETVATTLSRPCMTMVNEGLDKIKTVEQRAAEEKQARKRAEEEKAARIKAEEIAKKKAEEEAAAIKKAEEEEAARKKAEEEAAAKKKAEEEEAARKKAEEAAKREKRKSRIIHSSLKDLVSRLSKIEGYIAAAVLSPSGKLVTHNSTDQNIDLDKLATTFNTLFRQARKTSKTIGFAPCRETVFSYEDRAVIMRCSGAEAIIHFHLMAMMESCKTLDLVIKEMNDFHSRVQKELSKI